MSEDQEPFEAEVDEQVEIDDFNPADHLSACVKHNVWFPDEMELCPACELEVMDRVARTRAVEAAANLAVAAIGRGHTKAGDVTNLIDCADRIAAYITEGPPEFIIETTNEPQGPATPGEATIPSDEELTEGLPGYWQRWRAHKIVEAFQVHRFETLTEDGVPKVRLISRTGKWDVTVTSDWLAKHSPERYGGDHKVAGALLGGYVVRYPDSYLSWSPQKAFEQGYRPV